MTEPLRIDAFETHEKIAAGKALLVCAYEEGWQFRKARLAGAIALRDLTRRAPGLDRQTEIIFYCACPREETAVKQALKLAESGFGRVGVLGGGVDAWTRAGFRVIPDPSPLARLARVWKKLRGRGDAEA